MNNKNLKKWIITAMFSALITLMTWVPYLGYINYGGFIEITTLHIIVIAGAAFLNWKYGAVLGFVWGFNCWLRAFTNPLWIAFTSPLVSILPRILVGIFAGLIFAAITHLLNKKLTSSDSFKVAITKNSILIITAVLATLTNTVLVLFALFFFKNAFDSYLTTFKTVLGITIGINGIIEIVAAVILVPTIYLAMRKVSKTS